MKSMLTWLLGVVLLAGALGCGGGDKDRGKNSNLDVPKPGTSP